MRSFFFKRATVLLLAAMIVSPTTLLAATQDPAQAPPADSGGVGAPKGKLLDDENPLMIGKRNINSHQINFYSLDKEVNMGRQLAADVDRQGKFVEDPVVTEYVNRVGQNLALHSDAKIPFTIKVLDSDDVNAFALPGGFLYVNKGAILAADSEAELAGVWPTKSRTLLRVTGRASLKGNARELRDDTVDLYDRRARVHRVPGCADRCAADIPQVQPQCRERSRQAGRAVSLGRGYDPNNFLSF